MRFKNEIKLLTLRWRQVAVCDGCNSHVSWPAPSACVADRGKDRDNSKQPSYGWFHQPGHWKYENPQGKAEDTLELVGESEQQRKPHVSVARLAVVGRAWLRQNWRSNVRGRWTLEGRKTGCPF